MALLTFSDGIVKLNGEAVDGVLRSLTVGGELTFSEEKRDGLSGTVKVPMGWSDSDISCALDLITDNNKSCYDRLSEINAIFRAREEQKPLIYDVSNRHLSARGIRRVVFAKLDSAESSDDDVITVTLSFTEYEPSVVNAEKGETGISGGGPAAKNEPKPEASLMVDVK
jgi:hypothetical protein